MNRNKICPHCEIEYLPHIGKCADCGAVLLSHEEYQRALEEKKRLAAKAIEDSAVVREGELKWLDELHKVLLDSGIPSTITSDPCCSKGSCRSRFQLIVSKEDRERAQERITEYFREIHPELRASYELSKQGKCPACGSPVRADDTECPDCGLALVIFEEEDKEEEESCGGSKIDDAHLL